MLAGTALVEALAPSSAHPLLGLMDALGARIPALMDESGSDDALVQAQYADLQTWLIGILTKVDRAAMAVSLETRIPFLDAKVFRLAHGTAPIRHRPADPACVS